MIKHLAPRTKNEIFINKIRYFKFAYDFKQFFPKPLGSKWYSRIGSIFILEFGNLSNDYIGINTTFTQLLVLLGIIPSIFFIGIYSLLLIPFLFFGIARFYWYFPIHTGCHGLLGHKQYGFYLNRKLSSYWICTGQSYKVIEYDKTFKTKNKISVILE